MSDISSGTAWQGKPKAMALEKVREMLTQLLGRQASPVEVCGMVGTDCPRELLLRGVVSLEPSRWQDAVLREALAVWPLDPAWDFLDSEFDTSIETILMTARELRWDHYEEQVPRLEAAIQSRPGREGVCLCGGLKLGAVKPLTLKSDGILTISDSDVTGWKPKKLCTDHLHFDNCTGILELGEAIRPVEDPDEDYVAAPLLQLDPDLEVRSSGPSLAKRFVSRRLPDGLEARYFLHKDASGWSKDCLDPEGMDLGMPVSYWRVPSPERLRELPQGAALDLFYSEMETLPSGWVVKGFLYLSSFSRLKTLPEGLRIVVQGSLSERCIRHLLYHSQDYALFIEDCPLETLPEGLSLHAGLGLRHVSLKTIPESLALNGPLLLSNSPLSELPDGLRVRELFLEKLPLKTLPNNLLVHGDLRLDDLGVLNTLPEGLRVGGDMRIWNCAIQSLPEDLLVQGDIAIWECAAFVNLPARLQVHNLYLIRLKALTDLPFGFHVQGDLKIEACSVETLSANLRVDGDLCLEDLPDFSFFPPGVRLGQGLYIKGCPALTSLPRGLVVPMDLGMDQMPWHSMSEGIEVGRDLGFRALPNFTHLPDEYRTLRGELWLEDLPCLAHLPEGLEVGTDLIIRNCPSLTRLPSGLKAGMIEAEEKLASTAGSIASRPPRETCEDPDAVLSQGFSDAMEGIAQTMHSMAYSPEFFVRGRLDEESIYHLWMDDRSGIGHPDQPLTELHSHLNFGFRHREGDFLLHPDDLERIHEQALAVLLSWDLVRAKVLFVTVADPDIIAQAIESDAEPICNDFGKVKPFVVCLQFFMKDFLGGGIVMPFGQLDAIVPPPPTRLFTRSVG